MAKVTNISKQKVFVNGHTMFSGQSLNIPMSPVVNILVLHGILAVADDDVLKKSRRQILRNLDDEWQA